MDPENTDETTESSTESRDQTPTRKVRDLKPEKDPMGGGESNGTPPTINPESKRSAAG